MARNFLLGYGERLTEAVTKPPGGGPKKHPYSFHEAQKRLFPKVQKAAEEIVKLPARACPNEQTVIALTLHPAYLAKSYYPSALFRELDLYPLGSRPRQIAPEKIGKKNSNASATTSAEENSVEIFASASRNNIQLFSESFTDWTEDVNGAEDIRKIEDFRSLSTVGNRVRVHSPKSDLALEVVLHASAQEDHAYVIDGFDAFLKELGIDNSGLARRIFVGELCFLPLKIRHELLDAFSQFSFLRVVRDIPSIRSFPAPMRMSSGQDSFHVSLPTEDALDKNIRIAVFDGGLPAKNGIEQWVKNHTGKDMGNAPEGVVNHGLAVTSALLFGPLKKGEAPSRPYAEIEHYPVFDEDSNNQDSTELFDVIERITSVLTQRHFDFVNLSIGPDIPVEDDEVHVWTAVLDDLFADGKTLTAIAAGNNGEDDHASGNARVQVPGDCVNALTVGATDRNTSDWRVANYSAIGPGRAPGIVKPDCLAFGGSNDAPFWVLSRQANGHCVPTMGTSFASPLALHIAVALRAQMGAKLSPLLLKALLIHKCQPAKNMGFQRVGWGKIPNSLDTYLLCADNEVRILFEGSLRPGKYLRAPIPVPTKEMDGKIHIAATFCFSTETDPQDPFLYTRSGLEIIFRPHAKIKSNSKSTHPKSDQFFTPKILYPTEQELRAKAHKWETTLHAQKTKLGSSLHEPVFDIHYNARKGGQASRSAKEIPYALIITIKAPKIPDLYNQIVRRYRGQLETLQPLLSIPVQEQI